MITKRTARRGTVPNRPPVPPSGPHSGPSAGSRSITGSDQVTRDSGDAPDPGSASPRGECARIGRGARALVVGFTLLLSLVFGVGNAQAGYTGNGGQQVDSTAHCEYSSGRMVVGARATQMFNYSAHANGQWVRYRILTRNITNGTGPWVVSAGWSAWVWIDADWYVGEVRIVQAQDVGTTTLYGRRGNSYQVAVQYDHWMGSSAVGTDYWPRYTGNYHGTPMYPSFCRF